MVLSQKCGKFKCRIGKFEYRLVEFFQTRGEEKIWLRAQRLFVLSGTYDADTTCPGTTMAVLEVTMRRKCPAVGAAAGPTAFDSPKPNIRRP